MIDESILNNIRQSFAAAVQRVRVDSIGRTLTFRESSVKEHKAFSKTVVSNANSRSVAYAATLAMMKNLCLEDDFDPYSISEFDRLKILVHLFSNNFFSKNLSIKCPLKSCGETVKYPLKYGTLLEMMDSVDCSDIVFENENEIGKVRVVSNFPNTKRYLNMLESIESTEEQSMSISRKSQYESMNASFSEIDAASGNGGYSSDSDVVEKIRKRREALKGTYGDSVAGKGEVFGNIDVKKVTPSTSLLDVADIYVKRIQISRISGSENEFDIDMSGFGYDDTEKILSVLPMGLFIRENGENVVKHATKSIFSKMSACVPKIVCPKCGYEISKRLTLQNFFIFG